MELNIANGVTDIGTGAFKNCYNLIRIKNLSDVTLTSSNAELSNAYEEIVTSGDYNSGFDIGSKYLRYYRDSKVHLMGFTNPIYRNKCR